MKDFISDEDWNSGPDFVSDEEWGNASKPSKSSLGPIESGIRGAAGGLVPFANQLQGAASALSQAGNPQADLLGAYRSARDSASQREAMAADQHPAPYYGGLAAGSLGQRFVPGLNALGPVASGALSGLSGGQADLTKGQFGQAAKDTALGGILGKGFEKGGQLISQSVVPVAKKLEEFANNRALKTALGSKLVNFRNIAGVKNGQGNPTRAQENLNRAGRHIREEGIIGPFTKAGESGPAAELARQKYGKQIGEVGLELDSRSPDIVDAKKLADEILNYATGLPGSGPGIKIQNKLISEAKNLEDKGKMGFHEAQNWKNSFPFNPASTNPLFNNHSTNNKLKQIISEEMEKTAGREGGNDLLAKYLNAKDKYGTFKNASSAAANEVPAEHARRWFSPSDNAWAGIGALGSAVTGNPLPVAIGLGHKVARERGAAFSSYTAAKLADILQNDQSFANKFGSTLMNAAQRGPAAIAVTHHLLLKNPEYKAVMAEEEQE